MRSEHAHGYGHVAIYGGVFPVHRASVGDQHGRKQHLLNVDIAWNVGCRKGTYRSLTYFFIFN